MRAPSWCPPHGSTPCTPRAAGSRRATRSRRAPGTGSVAERIVAMVRDPKLCASAGQAGVTAAAVAASAYGASTFAPSLVPVLEDRGVPQAAAGTVALIRLTLAIAYRWLVLGEMV